jgi:hypothetical protein
VTKVPKEVEEAVRSEEWTAAAVAKATDPPTSNDSEWQDRAAAFTQRMREQRQQEDEREQRVNRLSHQHPDPPVDDELRAFAQRQRAGGGGPGAAASCRSPSGDQGGGPFSPGRRAALR